MSIETKISVLPAFVEQILTNVNRAAFEMMRPFRQNFYYSRIGFGHDVVDDEKRTVDCSKQILVTTETPNYPLWRRMDRTQSTNQLEYKLCFAALSRTDRQASERMFQSRINSTCCSIVVNRKNEEFNR